MSQSLAQTPENKDKVTTKFFGPTGHRAIPAAQWGSSMAGQRQNPLTKQNMINQKNRLRRAVSEIELKRIDTTLDLSLSGS